MGGIELCQEHCLSLHATSICTEREGENMSAVNLVNKSQSFGLQYYAENSRLGIQIETTAQYVSFIKKDVQSGMK
jgi:uncharacterized protein YkuJ